MSEQTEKNITTATPEHRVRVGTALAYGSSILGIFFWLWLAEAASSISHPLGIGVYILILLAAIYVFVSAFKPSSPVFARLFSSTSSNTPTGAFSILTFVAVETVALVAGFGGLCRQLNFTVGGFSASQMGYWHWVRLGFSWLLDNVLFNASQIFGWQVSDIQANVLWSKVLIFAFNIALDALALATIVRYVQLFRANQGGRRTVKYAHFDYWMALVVNGVEFVLAALWIVPTVIFLGAVVEQDLSLDVAWSYVRLGIPVVLGGWLVIHALWGLIRFEEIWDKVQALAVMAIGIVLLYITIPLLLANLQV